MTNNMRQNAVIRLIRNIFLLKDELLLENTNYPLSPSFLKKSVILKVFQISRVLSLAFTVNIIQVYGFVAYNLLNLFY